MNDTPAPNRAAPAAQPGATTGVSQTQTPATAPAIKRDATGASALTDLYKQLERAKRLRDHYEAKDPVVAHVLLTGDVPTAADYIPHDAKAFAALIKTDVAAKVEALRGRIKELGFEAD
jgi:hypothetical protein